MLIETNDIREVRVVQDGDRTTVRLTFRDGKWTELASEGYYTAAVHLQASPTTPRSSFDFKERGAPSRRPLIPVRPARQRGRVSRGQKKMSQQNDAPFDLRTSEGQLAEFGSKVIGWLADNDLGGDGDPMEALVALLKDKERLDYVEAMGGTYTGRYVLRMSDDDRGVRLHETSREDGRPSVRVAIDEAMVT